MKIYSLNDCLITPGVPKTLYPHSFKFVSGPLIKEGGVGLEMDEPLRDLPELPAMLKERGAEAFAFGLTHLMPPDPALSAEQALLVSLDISEWFPDPNLGDQSSVLCWSGRRLLFRCPPGHTSIRNLKHNLVLRNHKGVPKVITKLSRIKQLAEVQEALVRGKTSTVWQIHT